MVDHLSQRLDYWQSEFSPPLLQIVEETIPELVKLKEEGLIRHIGITGLPLAIYKKVLDRCTSCFLFHCL